jgi:hypothetical protein
MKAGALAGLSAIIPVTGINALGQNTSTPPPTGTAPATDQLSRLTQMDFKRALYTAFNIRLTKSSVLRTELYAVDENMAGEAQGLDNFSLVFRSVQSTTLRQNTYQFEHSRLGTFNLFIVPAGSQGSLKFYRAIINRV